MYEGESFWEKIKSAKVSQQKAWTKIFDILNENKKLSNRINISLLLRKILKESDFISAISSRIDGAQEISNLNKLISITNEFFNDEFNTLYDYASFLNDAISSSEDEAQSHIEASSDGVNILTIHQAKGLEYPAVFLFKCNDTTQVNKIKSRSFTIDKNFGLLTKVPINENYFEDFHSAPIVGLYNLIESKKEIAELKRLLYVGLTRAKDFLFISYSDEGNSVKKKSFTALINEGLKQDFTQNIITLEGELVFLQKENEVYTNQTKSIKLEIPIVRDIEFTEVLIKATEFDLNKKKFLVTGIEDHSKGEVISATRFSTFSSCPLKYNLLYNYKLGDLIQQSFRFRSATKSYIDDDDYNRNELNSYLLDDESTLTEFSKFKGQLIHYALRKNFSREELQVFIEEKLKNIFTENIPELLKTGILNDLYLFYDSNEFKFLNSFTNYRNEFEAYLKEEDFYLFGILDKLIIEENKITIVDYKTDNIVKSEINTAAQKYLPQLKFYAYIISRLFNKKQQVEGRIIFIKYPENPFIFNFDGTADQSIRSGIKLMIESMRNNNYSVNLSACKDCIFADENLQCVKSRIELKIN
jgi:ATP-dependent helicase/nuclease subunit A